MNQTNVSNELAAAPVGKLLFKLAVPTVIAQLVNLLYNIVDRIYIGHMPGTGSSALTGIGLCFPIIYLISAFSALIGQGGAPRAAICMGQNKTTEANRILNNCFVVLIIEAVVLSVFFWIFGEPLLWLFGCSEQTIVYALPYMQIYVSGSIFVMLALGLNLFIRLRGNRHRTPRFQHDLRPDRCRCQYYLGSDFYLRSAYGSPWCRPCNNHFTGFVLHLDSEVPHRQKDPAEIEEIRYAP